MALALKSPIIQITNISPSCTLEQIRMLFGNIGVIQELVVYPAEGEDCPSKVCFIKYADSINAEVALHLHNTMFLDRALIILPLVSENFVIPDEKYADLVRAPLHTSAGIHPRSALWPLDVISMVVGRPGEQVIQTVDPRLSSMGFPAYPPLPAATDCNRIEEIRRTVLVTNLDPKITGEQVLEFFNNHAEVKCVRMAGSDEERAAYVEFTEQGSVVKAFGLMGSTLGDRQIMVQHSNCAIIKPNSSLVGLEEPIKKPKSGNVSTSGRIRSRSRSRSRRRSPSRSRRSRRSRSRSKRRSRTPRRSRSRRRGSRDRSRSRRDRRSRVRSPSTHRSSRRSRSRSRDRRRRSRERREKERRERHERDRARRDRRSRSRSKRRENGKDRKESRHDPKKDEKKTRERSVSHRSNRDKSNGENGVLKPKEVAVEPAPEQMTFKESPPSQNSPLQNSSSEAPVKESASLPEVSINDTVPVDPPKKPVGVVLAGPEEEDFQV